MRLAVPEDSDAPEPITLDKGFVVSLIWMKTNLLLSFLLLPDNDAILFATVLYGHAPIDTVCNDLPHFGHDLLVIRHDVEYTHIPSQGAIRFVPAPITTEAVG